MGYPKELLDGMEHIIGELDIEYKEKNSTVEQLNSEIAEKETVLAETSAAVLENQVLIK